MCCVCVAAQRRGISIDKHESGTSYKERGHSDLARKAIVDLCSQLYRKITSMWPKLKHISHNWMTNIVHRKYLFDTFCSAFSNISGTAGAKGDAGPLTADSQSVPVITEHPLDMTVARNEPVTLSCKASGSPGPDIDWFKDGSRVKTAPTDPQSQSL